MTTLTTTDIPLTTHFAVQILSGESDQEIAFTILQASKKLGRLFRRLEVIGTHSIGVTPFLRFRADPVDIAKILQGVQDDRGIITLGSGGYKVRLPDGRTGSVSTLAMHAPVTVGRQRMFKGTKIKGWENQFPV